MHRLKLQPIAKEIETEQVPTVAKRSVPITVTVPLIDLFARSYCYFYRLHGCTVVNLGKNLYRFTFPEGTSVQRMGINHDLLTLPDKTSIDVVSTPEGQSHLHVHVGLRAIDDVFMRDTRKEV